MFPYFCWFGGKALDKGIGPRRRMRDAPVLEVGTGI